MIIPVKFGDNTPTGLEDVVYSKLLTAGGRLMTDIIGST